MNHRTDLLEQDMAAVKSTLDEIRANYARREDLEGLSVRTAALEDDMATVKTTVEVIRSNYARREDLRALEQRFDSELPHLATRAELQELRSEMRAWMVGTAITLFIALATLQFSFYQLLKASINEQVQIAVKAAMQP